MPTNAFVAADMPFTSVTKLEAAVAAGPVALFETGVGMFAPVIVGNRSARPVILLPGILGGV